MFTILRANPPERLNGNKPGGPRHDSRQVGQAIPNIRISGRRRRRFSSAAAGVRPAVKEERLQKILARAGVASRRKIEEMIVEGRITVNGRVAVLGEKADPERDSIKVGRQRITGAEPKVYFAFNKPRGVITSLSDPQGRKTVLDYLPGVRFRIFPVGRLDYHSEGLLILTNDGDLAAALTRASGRVPKVYHVKIRGTLAASEKARLERGIRLDDGPTQPARVTIVRTEKDNTWVEMEIGEGRNRQIRRMMEAVGHRVQRLRRVRIGSLELGRMNAGDSRVLSDRELARLKRDAGATAEKKRPGRIAEGKRPGRTAEGQRTGATAERKRR